MPVEDSQAEVRAFVRKRARSGWRLVHLRRETFSWDPGGPWGTWVLAYVRPEIQREKGREREARALKVLRHT